VLRRPAGIPFTDEMILPRSELARTGFYNDFGRPNGMDGVVQAFTYREPTGSGFFAAVRSPRQGAFGPEQIDLLALLLPHLERAMRIDLKLRAAGVERDATADVLDRLSQGVVLLDATARALYANRAAEAMFREADGIGVDAAGLRAATPVQTAQLRRAIARATGASGEVAEGGSLQLERPSARRMLVAVVMPLPAPTAGSPVATAKAVVFVSDPERVPAVPVQRLRQLYGLTGAEAQAALALLDADGLRDAAERLGVGVNTVRTQVQRVFDKTGTRRQAEVVRLLTALGSLQGCTRCG
jgi:DNA-binding CsgD family transcriptional regulator